MTPEQPGERRHNGGPAKVVGLGAPISVRIRFEQCEIPALIDAIGDELTRYAASPHSDASPAPPVSDDPAEWSAHVGELRRMLADLQPVDTPTADVEVLWPTVVAHDAVHGAVRHTKRRADSAATGADVQAATAAREALAAALRTRREFRAVDRGGLDAVWL